MTMMKSLCAIYAFLLIGCSNPIDRTPMSDLYDLRKSEGKLTAVSGKLLPADTAKRTPFRLQLQDSTILYLGTFSSASNIDFIRLDKFSDKNVVIDGVVFFDSIPERYQITSRLNGPYLVEIEKIQLVQE